MRIFRKIWLLLACCFATAILTIGKTYSFSQMLISVEGTPFAYRTDNPFIHKLGRTMIPIRATYEKLGFTVDYYEQTKTVILAKGDYKAVYTLGSSLYTVNGEARYWDVTPVLKKNRLYIPMRMLMEDIGIKVHYNPKDMVINLSDIPSLNPSVLPTEPTDSVPLAPVPTVPNPNPPKPTEPIPPPAPTDSDKTHPIPQEPAPEPIEPAPEPIEPAPEPIVPTPEPIEPMTPELPTVNPNIVSLPTPREDGCFELTTIGQIQAIDEKLDGCFVLVGDIDASVTANWNEGLGFKPIGTESEPFTGVLDGQGFTVSNLTIKRPNENVGMFLYGWHAQFQDISFKGAEILGAPYGDANAGVLAAAIAESTSENISVKNSRIEGDHTGGIFGSDFGGSTLHKLTVEDVEVKGSGDVGGINGRLGYSDVYDVKGTGVNIEGTWAGGLFGWDAGGSVIRFASSSDGTVTGQRTSGGLFGDKRYTHVEDITISGMKIIGYEDAGGIAGFSIGGVIERVHVSGGTIEGRDAAGGIVGFSDGTMVHDISIRHMTMYSEQYAGGITGYAYGESIFERLSVSWTTILSSEKAGGFAALLEDSYIGASEILNATINGYVKAGIFVAEEDGSVLENNTHLNTQTKQDW